MSTMPEATLPRRGHVSPLLTLFSLGALAAACADALPERFEDYASRCAPMHEGTIPETPDDPHAGDKRVFLCAPEVSELLDGGGAQRLPYPEGAVIVKDATRPEQGYPWLVAVAEKRDGRWRWTEYTRNFRGESFRAIAAPESVCVDCHRQAEAIDWIFTPLEVPR